MIIVGILAPGPSGAAATAIARRAAATGARVEMVGVAGPDAAGDAALLELAAASVGHATVTRSRADTIEPADLDLALRYLPDIRAVVLVRPEAGLLEAAAAAAPWSAAGLVVVGPLDEPATAAFEPVAGSAILLDPPANDPDETFAGFVAALAARLDAGEAPDVAWRSTVGTLAADRVE